MSFEHASVTKGLMFGFALTSVAVGLFDLKHYLNLQLVPHISKHHQYWRLPVHHLACASSSDLLLIELLLYNIGVPIERAFGSVKYASFFLISAVTTMLASFVALLVSQVAPVTRTAFNNIPPGPVAIMFAILYQYMRLVPPAYHFRVFGVGMSDKVWAYAVAAQLAVSRLPATLLPAAIGVFVGYLYRSDVLQLKSWRISPRALRLAETWIKPLLGDDKPERRTHRVLPDPQAQTDARRRVPTLDEDEVITTARSAPRRSTLATRAAPSTAPPQVGEEDVEGDGLDRADAQDTTTGTGVVRQWMSELANGARPVAQGGGTVRVPSESEITILTGMFPDIEREVVLGVLQRSANIEGAAETLIRAQSTS
ncbi:hypothetical protein C8Q80DRAFT_1217935 [Daedaleopsis nitida]|nr:hypothetical protein C8Q80DRAFT_1217935 [Daedaleopsis nitida]